MTGFPFTKQIFIVLTAVIVLGFAVVYQSAAEAQPSTLSGRVIGTEGEPIAEASIALLYVEIGGNGSMDTLYDRHCTLFYARGQGVSRRNSREKLRMKRNFRRSHPF